jgi:hypothetical protein
MSKNYQTEPAGDVTSGPAGTPEQVIVAMAEIAGAVEEGLLALAVAAGFQVMATVMDNDVAAICGPKGRHNPERAAVRHGSEDGSVTLGGRRVPVRRPRVRAADGSGEVAVASYEVFSSTDLLGRMAMERIRWPPAEATAARTTGTYDARAGSVTIRIVGVGAG